MRAYLDAVSNVLHLGMRKENRTGVDTISTFGVHYEHDMSDGFPLLTTKAMKWEHIIVENLWFLSGSRNIEFLRHYGVKFWDAWADSKGNVPGPYGNYWRHFQVHRLMQTECTHGLEPDYCDACAFERERATVNDQIRWVTDTLIRDPMSRRMVVSAWAPGEAQTSKLPPCHVMFVLNVQDRPPTEAERIKFTGSNGIVTEMRGDEVIRVVTAPNVRRLNLHLTQRSCDMALGVPYNLAGYSFLLHLFARFGRMEPGVFSHSLVDAHVYTSKPNGSMSEYDHVPGLHEQLLREPRRLPRLVIDPSVRTLEDVESIIEARPSIGDLLAIFKLEGYNPHPPIGFKVAV